MTHGKVTAGIVLASALVTFPAFGQPPVTYDPQQIPGLCWKKQGNQVACVALGMLGTHELQHEDGTWDSELRRDECALVMTAKPAFCKGDIMCELLSVPEAFGELVPAMARNHCQPDETTQILPLKEGENPGTLMLGIGAKVYGHHSVLQKLPKKRICRITHMIDDAEATISRGMREMILFVEAETRGWCSRYVVSD